MPIIGSISRSTLNLSQAVVSLFYYHKMMRKDFVTVGLKPILPENDFQSLLHLTIREPPSQFNNKELYSNYTLSFNGVDRQSKSCLYMLACLGHLMRRVIMVAKLLAPMFKLVIHSSIIQCEKLVTIS